jgi:hypothetical protein
MDAILKVPYNYSDPAHDFDCGEEINELQQQKWQQSMMVYNKLMIDNYKKYDSIINRNIHRLGQNMAINNEGAKEEVNIKQQNVYFTETKAIIRDMYNQEISIDTLIGYHKTKEPFIIDIQLPVYEHNDELEPEVKAWKRETIRINKEIDDPGMRLAGFSKRDFRLEFPGNKSTALLKDSKLVDIVNNHTFMFLVDQIIFSK